ncbi:MAG: phosphatase PAP2/dual specificity phosphatase family protein [Puniceicoccales bacterium]|jgi:membrane-associated phospholipid phosphatase|nr:phosphatase PAP2/dual specificity phosphatase family protein [Puniceicoccales bacterium]
MDDPPAASIFPRRPWGAACLWLAFLGPFFFAAYGFANQFTAQRGDVPSIVFDWERSIPFWPWTILPYWSMDALYAVSIFLCRTRAELRTHGLRLAAMTVVSTVCFLLFPLRFSFEKPATDGIAGWLFDALANFDLPYNQAPSLHIGLLWLVALRFAAHTPRRWRWAVYGWAVLIALSVLTTWQHHFIDVVTGFAAGVGVAYAIPSPDGRWHLQRRRGISASAARRAGVLAGRYFAGALVAAVPLAVAGNAWWTWLLMWPAVACVFAAAGYVWLGAAIFQKDANGFHAPSAAVLLAPLRFGLWLSRRLRARRLPVVSRIAPGLALGAYPEATAFDGHPDIGAVLDLTAEFSRPPAVNAAHCAYRVTPRTDLLPPVPSELAESVAALHALRREAPGKTIFVHCALGLSRSAIVAAAWLLETGAAATPEVALAQIRAARPQVVLTEEHTAALVSWWAERARTESKN